VQTFDPSDFRTLTTILSPVLRLLSSHIRPTPLDTRFAPCGCRLLVARTFHTISLGFHSNFTRISLVFYSFRVLGQIYCYLRFLLKLDLIFFITTSRIMEQPEIDIKLPTTTTSLATLQAAAPIGFLAKVNDELDSMLL
jgi:hypothetical protein